MDAEDDTVTAPDLPRYTTPGHPEHLDRLEDSKGGAWLWLRVQSRAKETKQPPFYLGGDAITGTVELDFDKAGGAKGVSIAVTAGVTAVGQEEDRFLYIPQALWDHKIAPPARPSGLQSWSFAISLPDETIVPAKGKRAPQTYPLPPSFSERASPAYIEYKLVVTVRRGVFKANQTLATSFVYLPVWRADPPSQLRQAAYRDGSVLSGPELDPEGWQALHPATVAGTLFNTRQIELQCTLAIAKPLSYARGSPIPLLLTITGDDEQAIDLLATPKSVKLHLVRSRVLGTYATDEDAIPPSDHVFRESVGTAYFWLPTDGVSGTRVRTLQGELNVKVKLKPSFVIPGFAVRYALALLPLQAPGFSPSATAVDPLVTENITVTSFGPTGVMPRSFAPPGYVHEDEADYNNSVGYLENGNQRFLHHAGHGGI